MRMTADHLPADSLDNIIHCKKAFLLGDPGLKHDMHQNVAQLLAQILRVAGLFINVDSGENLIDFALKIFFQGVVRLDAVPRTAVYRVPQDLYNFAEILKCIMFLSHVLSVPQNTAGGLLRPPVLFHFPASVSAVSLDQLS